MTTAPEPGTTEAGEQHNTCPPGKPDHRCPVHGDGCMNNPPRETKLSSFDREIYHSAADRDVDPLVVRGRARVDRVVAYHAAGGSLDLSDLVADVESLRDQLAAAQAERDRLQEWRHAVSGAIKQAPWFEPGDWGGDKEGWGYHVEMVGFLIREDRRLRAQLEQQRTQTQAAQAVVEAAQGVMNCMKIGDNVRSHLSGAGCLANLSTALSYAPKESPHDIPDRRSGLPADQQVVLGVPNPVVADGAERGPSV